MTNSIYKIDTETLIPSLLLVENRLPVYEHLIGSYDSPLQRLNDNMMDYIYGSSYSVYSSSFTYSLGDRVMATASNLYSIYESQIDNNNSNSLSGTAWGLWNTYNIGMIERAKIRANTMVFEYGLNQYYGTTFSQPTGVTMSVGHSDIYLTDNPVNVPVFIIGGSIISSDVYRRTSNAYIFGTGSTGSFMSDHFYETFQYTIHVPNWLLTSLPATESNIRTIADKYNIAGIKYSVIGY